uniref:Ubiquinone/menaquinone biosynthesis C-methylase UbiE n=1 Tax=Candidatus Kentrum sp. DK TaxID=2126562 RepID=A0A450S341_9GAMM|nr:MAG: Ubiquinone/menaquinone biosynthesis C-methylase UbiE [Candidatus Kentron sp. DK]
MDGMDFPLSETIRETVYRLDGPLRWAIGENTALVRKGDVDIGATVLDVGAGTGYLSLPLAKAVGDTGHVVCLDTSPELLGVLRTKARQHRLEDRLRFEISNAEQIPFADNHFDAVFSSYTLHECGSRADVLLREMWRVLKPHRRLVLADYRAIEDRDQRGQIEAWYQAHGDNAGDDELHLRFSLAELERMLHEAGFSSVELCTWADFHMHAIAIK